MRRLQLHGLLQVLQGLCPALAGEGMHDIQIEGGKAGLPGLAGGLDSGPGVMNAPKGL